MASTRPARGNYMWLLLLATVFLFGLPFAALRGLAFERAPGAFQHLVTYRDVGAVLNSVIGPGPTRQSERLYQSYIYSGGALEIVAVRPDTGEHRVFPSPVTSESGAWAMVVGPDGNMYVGTLPRAHVFRLDPRTDTLTDMGRPSGTEQYIWELAVGSDGKLYGGTYPSAKMIRFDPVSGKGEDLGRMDPSEHYARRVAASDDGFVYAGIGTSRARLVAYEIATGQHRAILPEKYQVTGTAIVQRGDDGKVYGQIAGEHFRLERWSAVAIPASTFRKAPSNRLKNGRLIVQATEGVIRVFDPRTNSETRHPFRYSGKETNIFRLGFGPDGMVYGSSAQPIHFFRVNPEDGRLTRLGGLGGGEIYAFLRHGGRLLGAAYSGASPLMIFDPAKPFSPGMGQNANPLLIGYQGQNDGWRPMAMIAGPGNKVYLGAVAGYGLLGGGLTVWDPRTNDVETFHHVVKDQSVVSLAMAHGFMVGATTVLGGGGSHPTQREAKLFVWDPSRKLKLFETVPVTGAREITDLVTAPNGLVYGIAESKTLFVFDPIAGKVVHTATLPFEGAMYNSVAIAPDGQIWGLAAEGVFAINPQLNMAKLIAKTPEPVTAGFAFDGRNLYYASGPHIYRYALQGWAEEPRRRN